MQELPKGGLLGKLQILTRRVKGLEIPLYAANACFFLILSVFPGLLVLLGLLRLTPLEVEWLGEMLSLFLPETFAAGVEALILTTYDNSHAAPVGLSALATLWSASRGTYSILKGLNRIYGVEEKRRWLRIRVLCVGYTLAFLLLVLLSLALQVFGGGLVLLLSRSQLRFARFLGYLLSFRNTFLLLLQTGFFALMFRMLPNRKLRWVQTLPGALLAALGWIIFSHIYSAYVERFASLRDVYGSVYAIALSMLWLYCCMCIVFCGGALNVLLHIGQNRER